MATFLLLIACDSATKLTFTETPTQKHSIAELKSHGTSSSQLITESISIRGQVTANDSWGEFSKSIIIEDQSGGITIAIDHTALFNYYPLGMEITVYCNGLMLRDYGGKIELGHPSESPSGIGRIPHDERERYLRIESTTTSKLDPTILTFDQITMNHIDTYVQVDEVQFTKTAPWCDKDPQTGALITTERTINNKAGQQFTIRTAATCLYAKELTPFGVGSLFGIIDYFNGKFALCISNREIHFSAFNAEVPPKAYP